MTTGQMGWRDAITKVLEEADRPLHYTEIADIIADKGLRTSLGNTPEGSVSAECGRMLNAKVRIKGSIIRKPSPGYWARAEVADKAAETPDEEDSIFSMGAYGLYWNRGLIDWAPSNGKLLGSRGGKAQAVDFADQDGIYLLHNGNEIVYVGKTHTPLSRTGLYARLRGHHREVRKAGRWDSFSWFGFKSVDPEKSELIAAPESISVRQSIELLEAILIEGLMPRLNMRSGENVRKAQETILFFQVEGEAAP